MKVPSAPSGSHVTALAVGPAAGPGAGTSAGRWHRSSTKYPTGAMRWMRRGSGHEWDYRYTVDGERVVTRQKRAVGDEILTYTLRDLEGKPLRTYRKANDTWLWEKDYVYRGRLLLATVAPAIGVRHVHVDHLGTPRFVTDRGKREAGYHALFPFGEESPDKPSATAGVPLSTQWDSERLRFTGHERDLQATLDAPADDLDYMHARYYNPNLGRFLSVDPGRDVEARAPQSWNMFAYARSNPMLRIDPQGRATLVFTISPGADSFERFGHSAVYVTNGGRGAGVSLGGNHAFEGGVAEFIRGYNSEGRTVLVTALDTQPDQEAKMVEFIKADSFAGTDPDAPGASFMARENCAQAVGNVLAAGGVVPSGSNPSQILGGLLSTPGALAESLKGLDCNAGTLVLKPDKSAEREHFLQFAFDFGPTSQNP